MKVNLLSLSLFGLVSVSAVAADWGGKELQESTNYALASFEKTKGKSTFLTVYNVTAVVRAQKNAVTVEIGYKDGKEAKSQRYFCHQHDTEIDCH